MHYDYDYDNDKKQDTKSVLKTSATISFCYFKGDEEWRYCRSWVGRVIPLVSTSGAVPAESVESEELDQIVGPRHVRLLQIHSKIWMACSLYQKRRVDEKFCKPVYLLGIIYCRSTCHQFDLQPSILLPTIWRLPYLWESHSFYMVQFETIS